MNFHKEKQNYWKWKGKSAIATEIFWIARNSFVSLFHMQIA